MAKQKQLAPTFILIVVILSSSWLGYVEGGYFVSQWALIALYLAGLVLVTSIIGEFGVMGFRWSTAALALFAAYTIWTFASLLWSPNQGDAWIGSGQTLLYLLAFWLSVRLVSSGASRRWVLTASAIGPAIIAALTLLALASYVQNLFSLNRLLGTVGYYNGEAAFLLVPFWVTIYLAGSRRINPILRGLILAGAVLSVDVAVLTQSRGAMVAMVVSLPVFFLISGQRLRGLFALAPIALALLATFPSLNDVYLSASDQESTVAALERALPAVWLAAGGVGLYGLLWGLLDQRWELTKGVTHAIGVVTLVASITLLILGTAVVSERVGNPVSWGEQTWEAFSRGELSELEGITEQKQGRYLSTASATARYPLWQVAWEDFTSSPFLGIGTHNYEATYYQLRKQAVGPARQPHSLPLEVLSERGLVGGALFFGFLATCLGVGLRKRFGYLSSEGRGQVGAMTAAVTYWFVHSSAEWFWQIPAVTLPAVIYLAMLAGPWQQVEAAPLRWSLRAVGIGVSLLAIVAVAPLYIADRYMAQSYTATDSMKSLEVIESAKRFNAISSELSQREAELATQIGEWERADEAYRDAIQLNPEHYGPYALLAMFYEQRGDLTTAFSYYQKALSLNPLGKDLNRKVAMFYEQRGDLAAALSYYRRALSVEPLDESISRKVDQLTERVEAR